MPGQGGTVSTPGPVARLDSWLARSAFRGRGGLAWLALVLGILLVVPGILILFIPVQSPLQPLTYLPGLLVALALSVGLGARVGRWTLLLVLLAALSLRFAGAGVQYSDVGMVTSAAIERALEGLNPYGVGYHVSTPPGAPFPYGPLALAWYLPFRFDPRIVEYLAAAGILGALALRGRPVGFLVYALSPAIILTTIDGSNDTSAGLLILVALIAMRRSVLLGGIALAVAVAFKLYAAAWVPAFVLWAGWAGLASLAASSAVLWLPAMLAWGIGPIADSLRIAQVIHEGVSGATGRMLQDLTGVPMDQEGWDRLKLVLGGITAVATLPLVRSSRSVVLAGAAVFVVTLYAGYWTSVSYLAALAPVVCWYLDDWTLRAPARVTWPGDPAAKVAGWLDARWPVCEEPHAGRRPLPAV
jgi:hypothetical protein